MFLRALGYSAAAGLTTVLGASIVFLRPRISRQELALLMGLAAGVMVSMVILVLYPVTRTHGDGTGFLLGLLGTVITIFAWKWSFPHKKSGLSLSRLGYLIMLGVILQDLPEGMAISLTNEVSSHAAAIVALGIALHDLPEGMAMAAPFHMAGASRVKIALQCLAVGAVTPLGTLVGKLAVTVMPNYLSIMMGAVGGILLFMGLFEIWPEAKEFGLRWACLGAALGPIIVLLASLAE